MPGIHNLNNTSYKKILAFAMIYLIWGTTYLFIRLAIDTIPPFMMAGLRLVIAGILFYSWCYWRFEKKPGTRDWGNASIPGILMFVGGNGVLTWSEQFIPSGLAALMIATVPIWMVLIDWLSGKGERPDKWTISGILLGLTGVAFLFSVDESILVSTADESWSVIFGILMLLFAAISWASGSLYSRHIKSTVSLQFTISIQILVGGIALLLLSLIQNEWSDMSIRHISTLSLFSVIYLIIFGTLLAYSAYIWLLRVSTPAKVGTYAFFNPLVAVVLGWLLLNESMTLHTIIGAVCILTSILLTNKLRFKLFAKTSISSFIESRNRTE